MAAKKVPKDNSLAKVNPALAEQWHLTKNGELTPRDVTKGSKKKVWWQCSKNKLHLWEAVIGKRNNGQGCPYCSGHKVSKDSCLATMNPSLSKEWHPMKNGVLTPGDVTKGSAKKVWWLCPKEPKHEWEAVIHSRSSGISCPYCSGQKVSPETSLASLYPALVEEWHKKKNGSMTPDSITAGSNRKVWWQCGKNAEHEWEAVVHSRSKNNRGCPYCAGKAISLDNCLATLNPNIAAEWHTEKNGVLTPKDVTVGSNKKAWWQCSRNPEHVWKTAVHNRSKGQGCPFCGSNTSEPELRIYSEMEYVFQKVEHRKKIDGVECDVFIPEYEIAIEFDGGHWHKDKVHADRKKNKHLVERGILIIRARGSGLEKITDEDVLCHDDKVTIQTVKSILEVIASRIKLKPSIKRKIKAYAVVNDFQNTVGFRKLLDMLPAAFPGTSLSDLAPDIASQWHPGKNGTLTPLDVTLYSHIKVWWLCSKNENHEWQEDPKGRVRGYGCPYCSGQRVSRDNCLAAINPELAEQWHPSKNGDNTPYTVTSGSSRKVWWRCQKITIMNGKP